MKREVCITGDNKDTVPFCQKEKRSSVSKRSTPWRDNRDRSVTNRRLYVSFLWCRPKKARRATKIDFEKKKVNYRINASMQHNDENLMKTLCVKREGWGVCGAGSARKRNVS